MNMNMKWRSTAVSLIVLPVVALTWTVGARGTGEQSSVETSLQTYQSEQGYRPEVEIWGREAMVVSTVPLATQAGARILAAGGNAVDAAVAVGAALNVTWFNNCQLGGDTVMLIYWAETGEFITLDAYSKVPANPELRERLKALPGVKGNPEAHQEEPRTRSAETGFRPRGDGVLVSMIPGTTAAWTRAMERFGTKPLDEVFAPAIDYAENGFPVNSGLARSLQSSAEIMMKYPSTVKAFYAGGRPPKPGELLVQKDLAGTLRKIASGGFDAFYKGEIAEAIVDYVQASGGLITMDDMAAYDVVWRQPYRTTYRGYDIVAAPPPTAGIHVLQQLNIVEGYRLSQMGYHSADALHVMIEATKLAGADRRAMGGDPDFVDMPVEGLLSKEYAAARRALIDMNRAMGPKYEGGDPLAYESQDTTHFVVRDRWGNIVSTTTTLGSGFGSKEVIEGTGLLLQDRTWWLALDPPSPNVVAPGRRANIGHSPIIILKDEEPFMAIGSPGGDTIRQTVFQGIVNVIDFGLNIQQAVEAARFAANPLENDVRIDSRISTDVLAELERRGHVLARVGPWRGPGTLEAFLIDDESGVIMAGYDPKGGSIAIGW